jgi:hypothetical protein
MAENMPFTISSTCNYDIVATSIEDIANGSGQLAYTIGDHNVDRQPSYSTPHAYANQGSISGGVGIPDDGKVGRYQLCTAFDNGSDGLTKSTNAIAFLSNWGVAGGNGDVERTIVLLPEQQAKYGEINVLFVSWRSGKGPYRSWIKAAYRDGSSEMVVDTGNFTDSDPSSTPGGTFGGAGVAGQGGILNTSDAYSFTNRAPNYPGTIRHKLALSMDRRLNGATIGTGNAALWEFDPALALDSSKTLESLTIRMEAPSDNVNREGNLFVLAISGSRIGMDGTLLKVH